MCDDFWTLSIILSQSIVYHDSKSKDKMNKLHMLCTCLLAPGHTEVQSLIRQSLKVALIVKHYKNVWLTVMTRALLGKAPAYDNHRLLLYHDNGSLW